MFDIPKTTPDPEFLAFLKGLVQKEPYRPMDFGRTALYGGGLDESHYEYKDSRSHPRHTGLEIERGSGTETVDMSAHHFEVVPSGETKRLFTSGLSGCTAIGIIAQQASGNRATFLQHANAFQMTLRDRGGVSLPGIGVVTGKAIIMAPGYGDPIILSEATEKQPQLEQADAVYDIANKLGQMVGTENVHILPYSADERTNSNPYANSLVVDVTQDGLGTFFADGWYGT